MKVITEKLLTRFSHFGRHIGREYFREGSREDNKAVWLHAAGFVIQAVFFGLWHSVGALCTTIYKINI